MSINLFIFSAPCSSKATVVDGTIWTDASKNSSPRFSNCSLTDEKSDGAVVISYTSSSASKSSAPNSASLIHLLIICNFLFLLQLHLFD